MPPRGCRPSSSLCCLPVVDPRSWFASLWQVITTTTDMTYTAFIVPLSLAFGNVTNLLDVYTLLDLVGSKCWLFFHAACLIRVGLLCRRLLPVCADCITCT